MKTAVLIADFKAAAEKLHAALTGKHDSELERAGAIQYFELAFELAWKSCKAKAEELGIQEIRSPKAALKEAKTQGWIREEKIWLEMLEARNRMAHVYSAEQAMEVYGKLPGFATALASLAGALGKADA